MMDEVCGEAGRLSEEEVCLVSDTTVEEEEVTQDPGALVSLWYQREKDAKAAREALNVILEDLTEVARDLASRYGILVGDMAHQVASSMPTAAQPVEQRMLEVTPNVYVAEPSTSTMTVEEIRRGAFDGVASEEDFVSLVAKNLQGLEGFLR